MNAELHLRQPERSLVGFDGDAIVAGERELQAAAERKAVDRGNRRHLERRDAPEHA